MLQTGLKVQKSVLVHRQNLIALVDHLVEQRPVDEPLFRDVFYPTVEKIPKDPLEWIDTLRTLFLLSLAGTDRSDFNSYKTVLIDLIHKVKGDRACPKIQLIEAYEALIKFQCGIPSEDLIPVVREGGAAPFEPEGHLPWGQTTQGEYHAELGLVWFLLGKFLQKSYFDEAAKQVAIWEIKVSKADHTPFPGLFCQESDYDPDGIKAAQMLLFKMTGLPYCPGDISRNNHLLFVYLDKITPGNTLKPQALPKAFVDRSMNLCGWRDPDLSLFFTTAGGGTGLGGFSYRSIEVLAYAPQTHPLNEAYGFGINTLPRNELKCHMSQESREITSRGLCRLTDVALQPEATSWNNFRVGNSPHCWLEVSQALKENKIEIETILRAIDEPPDLTFTFFVKACAVKMDQIEALPNQLRHFEMEISTLEIIGENCSIRLFQHIDNIPLDRYNVELIPLGGNRAFWGADFLISFPYSKQGTRNRWTLELA